MGKLNSLIKFGVFNANALLFLGGLGMIVVASVVLAADFIKLAKVIFMRTCKQRHSTKQRRERVSLP